MANIFQQLITPDKPKVLSSERISVYVPKATGTTAGIASYNSRDFSVNEGEVSLTWPMEMDVEKLSDPLTNVSRVKLLSDEFEATGNSATVTNTTTGVSYTSDTAEVQLNRKNRNAFTRPDLIMLDNTSDFDATLDTSTSYVKYTLRKNNPLEQPSLVQLNNNDFKRNTDGSVSINWPYAHDGSGSTNTNGFGLVKLASGWSGLKFNDDGTLLIDKTQITNGVTPTYGADASSGFTNYSDYVDSNGHATIDDDNYSKVAITKEAVGLSNVENKAFKDYVYTDFGTTMQEYFTNQFDLKLDKTTWNNLFSDWNPPTDTRSTPQKWLTVLDDEDESIWETIVSLKTFLGYYENEESLQAAHPATNAVYGSIAYVLDSNTYWAVKAGNVQYIIATDEELDSYVEENKSSFTTGDKIGILETNEIYVWNGTTVTKSSDSVTYEWYNTSEGSEKFRNYMETDATAYRADGVASAGASGMWAQSDHIHPTDTTRLAKDTYNSTTVNITSELTSDNSDFTFTLDADSPTRGVNIPYVRKAQALHNWNGQTTFTDTEDSTEYYWRGTSEEFEAQADNIKNNSFVIVDDGVSTSASAFITKDDMSDHGFDIDDTSKSFAWYDPSYGYSTNLGNQHVATINPENGQVAIADISIYNSDLGTGFSPIISNGSQVIRKLIDANMLLQADENGDLASSTIHNKAVLTTSRTGADTVLSSGYLLKSSSDNVIETADFGTTANKLIVSDGLGGLTVFDKDAAAVTEYLVYDREKHTIALGSSSGGRYPYNTIYTHNLYTSWKTNSLMVATTSSTNGSGGTAGTTSGRGCVAPYYISGYKFIQGDGYGGIEQSSITANRYVYTAAEGQLAAIPVSSTDIGKVLAIGNDLGPQLLSIPSQSSTLPVTTYTSDPGDNSNGMVICRLDSDPGTYSEGVLYMW